MTDSAEMTVGELGRALPERCFVLPLTRDGRTWIPDATERIEPDDRLTLLGRSEAVEEATDRLSPNPDEDIVDLQSLNVDDWS